MAPANDCKIDPALVAAMYAEHADELRNFLIGVLRNAEAAGEVVQATFAKAVEVGHTAHAETLKGWLFRVAFHEALAYRRRMAVHDKATRRIAWNAGSTQESAHDSPHDNVVRDETVESIRIALDALPVEQKKVVSMRIYDEKTFATIAAELGVPLGTVLTRMQLALRKLRRTMNSDRE